MSTSASRAEQAATQIAALIGGRPPGAGLGTKEELRVTCGVSVGTINEAIRLLQARGLVTVRPGAGGGLFVAEQSPMVRLGNAVQSLDVADSAADAVRIRDALDPLLVADALWHASPADLDALRGHLAEMDDAAQHRDGTGFIRADWALHARIAGLSPNTLLRSIYLSLLDLVQSHTLTVPVVTHFPAPTGLVSYMTDRHRNRAALVEAIAARDSDTALRLISERHPNAETNQPG